MVRSLEVAPPTLHPTSNDLADPELAQVIQPLFFVAALPSVLALMAVEKNLC
jgi:hypothetical protein